MTDRRTLRDVNHSHPDHETRDFHWFQRGLSVAADGGRHGAASRSGESHMRDVSHVVNDDPGTDRIWDGTRVREIDDE